MSEVSIVGGGDGAFARSEGRLPWDIEQDFKSVAPYTLEETYEVVEAIEQDDPQAIRDELGDLLFRIVFHAQMGREAGLFDIDQIANHVADKMIERHPHVFGDRNANTAQAVLANWENDKAKKREAAGGWKAGERVGRRQHGAARLNPRREIAEPRRARRFRLGRMLARDRRQNPGGNRRTGSRDRRIG